MGQCRRAMLQSNARRLNAQIASDRCRRLVVHAIQDKARWVAEVGHHDAYVGARLGHDFLVLADSGHGFGGFGGRDVAVRRENNRVEKIVIRGFKPWYF